MHLDTLKNAVYPKGYTPPRIDVYLVLSRSPEVMPLYTSIVPLRIPGIVLLRTNFDSILALPIRLKSRHELTSYSAVFLCVEDLQEDEFPVALEHVDFEDTEEVTAIRLYKWQMPNAFVMRLRDCSECCCVIAAYLRLMFSIIFRAFLKNIYTPPCLYS